MIRPPNIFIFSCDIVNWCKKYKTIQDYANLHLTRSFARGLGLDSGCSRHTQPLQSTSLDSTSQRDPWENACAAFDKVLCQGSGSG